MTSHDLAPAPGARRPRTSASGRTGRRDTKDRRGGSTPPLGRRAWAAVAVGGPALIAMAMGWHQRWVGDDGMIYTRTVRQILAGHGPVFNVGERAEASTGTLWQWLVAAGTWAAGRDPAFVSVVLGILLTGTGYALAVAAARRAVRPLTPLTTGPLLPLGMLVLLAVKADWDYASSGLENGLSAGWIGLAWWRLVAARDLAGQDSAGRDAQRRQPGRRVYVTAFVLGLGPLVRPDLAVVSAVFLAALWWILRPPVARALALLGTAVAAPAAYEVFRAGYYGVLVPLPALTKEASDAVWTRGFTYLANFADPYRLWLPLMLLAALAACAPRRALRPELLAPPVAGLLSWLYVCRVGGDFMHGRVLLPGLLLLMLPLCAVPVTRPAARAATAGLVVWTVLCALLWRPPASSGSPYLILDEQAEYRIYTAAAHPVSQAAHALRDKPLRPALAAARAAGRPVLLLQTPASNGRFVRLPLARGVGAPVAGVYDLLGYNGIVTPLGGVSVDPLGLAYPLVAHQARATVRTDGRSGHEKPVDPAWIVADYTPPGTPVPAGVDPARVRAARHALACGPLADLQASVRAPLTPARFWHNLTGAWSRTAFRYPDDPLRAEQTLCRR
jgi:arabinofuranosyltransferase